MGPGSGFAAEDACPQGSSRRVGRRTKRVTPRQRGVERGCLWHPSDRCDTSTSDHWTSAPPSGPSFKDVLLFGDISPPSGPMRRTVPRPILPGRSQPPPRGWWNTQSLRSAPAPQAVLPLEGCGRALEVGPEGVGRTAWGADLGFHCVFIPLSFHAVIQLNGSLGPQIARWCWMWV